MVSFKTQWEATNGPISDKLLAKKYLGCLTYSNTDLDGKGTKFNKDDKMSEKTIGWAVYIHKHLLSLPGGKQLLVMEFEKNGHNSFLNSLSRLKDFATSCKGEVDIALWQLDVIGWWLEGSYADIDEGLSKNPRTGNPGLLDMALYLHVIGDFLMRWISTVPEATMAVYPEHVLQLLREKVFSWEGIQTWLTDDQDRTWISTVPQRSISKLVGLWMSIVVLKHKTTMKTSLRCKSDVCEFLTEGATVKEACAELVKMRKVELEQDTAKRTAAQAATQAKNEEMATPIHSPIRRILGIRHSNSGDDEVPVMERAVAFKKDWSATAMALLNEHCKFVVMPANKSGIRDVVKVSVPGSWWPKDSDEASEGTVVVTCIAKETGINLSKPLSVQYSPSEEWLSQMMKGILLGRAEAVAAQHELVLDKDGRPEKVDKHVALILQQHPNLKLCKILGSTMHTKYLLKLGYTEESIEARVLQTKGSFGLEQIENYDIIRMGQHHGPLPRRPRLRYVGPNGTNTTAGTLINDVIYPDPARVPLPILQYRQARAGFIIVLEH